MKNFKKPLFEIVAFESKDIIQVSIEDEGTVGGDVTEFESVDFNYSDLEQFGYEL